MSKHFVFPVKIFPDDTDCFEIVYHANYLKYFSHARIEWFAALGHGLHDLKAKGIIFPVKHADLEYFQPARLGDELEILTTVTKLGRVSVTFSHKVRLARDLDSIICQGTVKIACVDEQMRPRKVPEFLCQAFT